VGFYCVSIYQLQVGLQLRFYPAAGEVATNIVSVLRCVAIEFFPVASGVATESFPVTSRVAIEFFSLKFFSSCSSVFNYFFF
jgi:hypothetical protein